MQITLLFNELELAATQFNQSYESLMWYCKCHRIVKTYGPSRSLESLIGPELYRQVSSLEFMEGLKKLWDKFKGWLGNLWTKLKVGFTLMFNNTDKMCAKLEKHADELDSAVGTVPDDQEFKIPDLEGIKKLIESYKPAIQKLAQDAKDLATSQNDQQVVKEMSDLAHLATETIQKKEVLSGRSIKEVAKLCRVVSSLMKMFKDPAKTTAAVSAKLNEIVNNMKPSDVGLDDSNKADQTTAQVGQTLGKLAIAEVTKSMTKIAQGIVSQLRQIGALLLKINPKK